MKNTIPCNIIYTARIGYLSCICSCFLCVEYMLAHHAYMPGIFLIQSSLLTRINRNTVPGMCQHLSHTQKAGTYVAYINGSGYVGGKKWQKLYLKWPIPAWKTRDGSLPEILNYVACKGCFFWGPGTICCLNCCPKSHPSWVQGVHYLRGLCRTEWSLKKYPKSAPHPWHIIES